MIQPNSTKNLPKTKSTTKHVEIALPKGHSVQSELSIVAIQRVTRKKCQQRGNGVYEVSLEAEFSRIAERMEEWEETIGMP